jgi:AraC-like DNA-binding protein
MKSVVRNDDFAPLVGVLQRFQFSLKSDTPPILLAAQTREDFKAQQLPPHCVVTPRKLRGKRVRTRKSSSGNSSVIARWPQDGLVESSSPSLLLVLDGHADIDIADYRVRCGSGDVVFLPARIPKLDGSRPHYEKATPESHCDLLFISFLPIGLHNISIHICHSRGNRHEMSGAGETCWLTSQPVSLLFDALAEIAQSGNSKSTFHLVAAVLLLINEGLEQGKCYDPKDFPARSLSTDTQDPISKAHEYMQNHLSRPLSIDLVAHWVGLSRTLFIRQFREKIGKTFKAHLTELRLEEAKVLLTTSHLSIDSISKRVGLTSGQLRNLFHDRFQCAPRDFRHTKINDHK